MTTIQNPYSSLLTPAGSGAIALIRVTGLDAWKIVSQVFEPVSHAYPLEQESNKLRYGWIVQDGEKIDDVIVSIQQQETTTYVDISTHAGIRIVERVLAALSDVGAPLLDTPPNQAWPACSVIEREALADLQQVKNKRGAVLALRLRTGLPSQLTNLAHHVHSDPHAVREALLQLKDGFRQTHAMLHGLSIALIGPPNSGKSTLFNRLLGRSAAVVSETAGTTRDWITGEVEIRGLHVSIIDTAGRHRTEDNLENFAITKGHDKAAHVDGCILVLDASATDRLTGKTIDLWPRSSMPTVVAMNKCDLDSSPNNSLPESSGALTRKIRSLGLSSVKCSAVTNEGVDLLLQNIIKAAGVETSEVVEDNGQLGLFTVRQIDSANKILDMLPKYPSLAAKTMMDDLVHPIYRV